MKKLVSFILFMISFTSYSQDLEKGKVVFTTNCAGCHNMEKNVVGPALQDVIEKQGRDWTEKWILNSTELIGTGDVHANEVFNEYNKMAMPAFNYLPKEDFTNLLDYLEKFKQDKADKTASETPALTKEGEGETKGKGLPFYVILFFIVTLVLVVAAGLIVVISLRLISSHTTKVKVVNQQLMNKLNIDNSEINKSVEKLFDDEVEKRLKEKVQSLKGDINDRLKDFK